MLESTGRLEAINERLDASTAAPAVPRTARSTAWPPSAELRPSYDNTIMHDPHNCLLVCSLLVPVPVPPPAPHLLMSVPSWEATAASQAFLASLPIDSPYHPHSQLILLFFLLPSPAPPAQQCLNHVRTAPSP